MKKLLKLGVGALLGMIGISLLFTQNNPMDHTAKSKDKFVLFGNVDFSDLEDEESEDVYVENDEDSDGNWFENFVKDHKTPFSKTISK